MNDPLGLGVIAGARPEPGWFVRREPQPWHAALPKWIWATNLELPWFGIHDCFAPEGRHSSVAFWGDGMWGGATRLWFLAREFESCDAIRWLLAQGADVEVGTVEDPWNTTEKRNLHIGSSEGRAVPGQRTWQRPASEPGAIT